jgi:hypothetical protein
MEETVPVPLIAISNSEQPDKHAAPFEGSGGDLRAVAEACLRAVLASGCSRAQASARLKTTEPFDLFPEMVDELAAKAGEEDAQKRS